MGSLLRYWLGFCTSGIVLLSLLVSSLLGSFLTGAMFVSWFTEGDIDGQVLGRDRGFVVFHFQALLVVLVFFAMAAFLEALKEFDSTEKHQHTLQDTAVPGGVSSRSKVWKRLIA